MMTQLEKFPVWEQSNEYTVTQDKVILPLFTVKSGELIFNVYSKYSKKIFPKEIFFSQTLLLNAFY